MSKWIDKNAFSKFVDEKSNETEEKSSNFGNRKEIIFPTPEKGTQEKSKNYTGRFLPDPNGKFIEKYFYHFFANGESWFSSVCPKTWDMNNYCPICAVVTKLWKGSKEDKALASQMKRKQKFVANFYVENDPRDTERAEEEKINGTVKLYEFPGAIESKLKQEITDREEGLGSAIFDPSEDGYNFIVRVKSKTPNANGRVWPDYGDSNFSRKSSAIADSDKKIEKIMSSCHDIYDYIKSMEKDESDIIEVLKNNMVWELIEDEHAPSNKKKEDKKKEMEEDLSKAFDGDSSDGSDDNSDDDSDDDLLKEIESLRG